MVPVGGSIIFSKDKKLIKDISSTYPGRASSSPIIDLTITLLSMGKNGLNALYAERKQLYKYFIEKLELYCQKSGDRILATPENSISIAMAVSKSVAKLGIDSSNATELGAYLFKRRVMGARVVFNSKKEINGLTFSNYGSHAETYPELPYITVACAIGSEKRDIDVFVQKLEQGFKKSEESGSQN